MEDERPAPPPEVPEHSTTPPRPRLRDRLWTFRSMLLVACATLLVGGLSGAGIVAVATADDDERRGPPVMLERDGRGHPGGPPGERRPWHHRHFYWNDTPTPTPDPPPGVPPRD